MKSFSVVTNDANRDYTLTYLLNLVHVVGQKLLPIGIFK